MLLERILLVISELRWGVKWRLKPSILKLAQQFQSSRPCTNFLFRPPLIIYRPVNLGGGIKLSLSRKEGSFSVLVPSQDDLLRRHCQGMYKQELRTWFKRRVSSLEMGQSNVQPATFKYLFSYRSNIDLRICNKSSGRGEQHL